MLSFGQSKSLQHAALRVPRPRQALGEQIALSLRFETANGASLVVHLVPLRQKPWLNQPDCISHLICSRLHRWSLQEMVDRAAGQTNSRLNFAPVLFWVDRTVKSPMPSQTSKISHFCFQRYVQSDGTVKCQPATQTDIDAF
ncbi:hypothetical protein WJX82_002368 [Trebouxia sp. C0006]